MKMTDIEKLYNISEIIENGDVELQEMILYKKEVLKIACHVDKNTYNFKNRLIERINEIIGSEKKED